MTKDDFALMILEKKCETGDTYLDIIIKFLEDENFPVFFDNVRQYINEDIKSRLWNECKEKNLIKESYYKRGLYRYIDDFL